MLDPDLNAVGDDNISIQTLIGEEEENPKAKWARNYVETNCRKLVSLDMTADPKSGAFAYFSAATRLGHSKLIIHEYDDVEEKYTEFRTLETEEAKSKYDKDTGFIKDFCAFEGVWYFCHP